MDWTRILGISVSLIGFLSALPANAQVVISSAGVTFPDETEQKTSATGAPYEIGDVGPAGGFVFYVTVDGLHGLEAAPEDQSDSAIWGCYDQNLAGASLTAIGTGERNTSDIIGNICASAGTAAVLAAEYMAPSGYFDWYLPSETELDLMYHGIGEGFPNLGGFADSQYWSSSEVSGIGAHSWNFDTNAVGGGQGAINTKDGPLRVRAIRAF